MDHEDGYGDGAGLDGGVDGDSGGRMEEPSGGDSGGVSPPLRSSLAAAFYLLFRGLCVSPTPPRETPRVTILIVGFRSRRRHWDEDRRHRRLEAQDRGPQAAKESGPVGPSLWALGSPFVRFLRSYALFLPKTDARKILGHLDIVWVPETSKYRK